MAFYVECLECGANDETGSIFWMSEHEENCDG